MILFNGLYKRQIGLYAILILGFLSAAVFEIFEFKKLSNHESTTMSSSTQCPANIVSRIKLKNFKKIYQCILAENVYPKRKTWVALTQFDNDGEVYAGVTLFIFDFEKAPELGDSPLAVMTGFGSEAQEITDDHGSSFLYLSPENSRDGVRTIGFRGSASGQSSVLFLRKFNFDPHCDQNKDECDSFKPIFTVEKTPRSDIPTDIDRPVVVHWPTVSLPTGYYNKQGVEIKTVDRYEVSGFELKPLGRAKSLFDK